MDKVPRSGNKIVGGSMSQAVSDTLPLPGMCI